MNKHIHWTMTFYRKTEEEPGLAQTRLLFITEKCCPLPFPRRPAVLTVSKLFFRQMPTPENGIRNPSIDIEGIVYRKLITPSVGFAAFWNPLINMPAKPPMTTAIRMAINEISRCSHNSPAKKSQRSVKSVPISLNIVIPPFSQSPAPDSSQRTIRSAGSVPAGSCTEFLLQYTAAGSSARTARIRYIHL